MNNTYQSLNWNGQTLEISVSKDFLLSKLTGEEQAILKVTSTDNANPLIHNTYPAVVIQSAGGAVDFVDVMLSAQLAA
ncbi:MAG: hypothetical protein Q8K65_03500 [Alphaproteobacteria bacterium]|nr:hypothetical protein [Alphaproteobacteria bacterium]